jgi:hypothetical protein
MATPKVGILPSEERMAIFRGAKQLGLDPYEFGAFLSLEAGPNMDPNIVGGAGGRHKGLIQFGQNEQQMYGISGPQTRAGQMPAVLKYFEDRGYKPGMGIARAYATVLGGNPNVSLTAEDSFGTSVQSMLPRFKKGGDYYANAQRVLGDIPAELGGQAPVAPVAKNPTTTAQRKQRAESLLGSVKENIVEQLLRSALQVPTVPGVFGTTVGFQNPGKLF